MHYVQMEEEGHRRKRVSQIRDFRKSSHGKRDALKCSLVFHMEQPCAKRFGVRAGWAIRATD